MTEQPDATPPTRRGLLKTLAALGAVSMTGTGVATAASPLPLLPAPRALKVALMVPGKARSAGLTDAFQRGLKLALKGQPVTLALYPTGPLPHQAQATARTALATRPDLLILLGDGLAEHLRAVLHGQPVPVLAAELGAYLPGAHRPTPLSVTVSLHAAEAEWALGQHLARTGTRRLHLLLSQMDAGYDLPFAFTSGFERSGGQLAGMTVFDDERPDVTALMAAVRSSGAKAVHLISGGHGDDVVSALHRAGVHVTASGLSAPAHRARLTSALASAAQHTPQLGPDATPVAAAHPAAVLGFDAGQWLSAALTHLPAHLPVTPLALHAALTHTPVQGARGTLQADANGLLRAPIVLRQAGRAALTLAPPHPEQAGLQRHDGLRSGWIYPYLHA